MEERQPALVLGHQREARAVDDLADAEADREALGELRLAGAERPDEREAVAWLAPRRPALAASCRVCSADPSTASPGDRCGATPASDRAAMGRPSRGAPASRAARRCARSGRPARRPRRSRPEHRCRPASGVGRRGPRGDPRGRAARRSTTRTVPGGRATAVSRRPRVAADDERAATRRGRRPVGRRRPRGGPRGASGWGRGRSRPWPAARRGPRAWSAACWRASDDSSWRRSRLATPPEMTAATPMARARDIASMSRRAPTTRMAPAALTSMREAGTSASGRLDGDDDAPAAGRPQPTCASTAEALERGCRCGRARRSSTTPAAGRVDQDVAAARRQAGDAVTAVLADPGAVGGRRRLCGRGARGWRRARRRGGRRAAGPRRRPSSGSRRPPARGSAR